MTASGKHIRIAGLTMLFAGLAFSRENIRPDSAFHGLSMQELQNAAAYYSQEVDALIQEKNDLIRKGIEDGERLLPGASPKVVPEILIRLADLYYHQEKDAFLDRMKMYEDSLEIRGKAGSGTNPIEPRLVFHKSLQTYRQIADSFPDNDLVDDALYYKAFLSEEMGDHEKAQSLYLQLIETHPQSAYLPEAYMRLGEFYFNAPGGSLDLAIDYYQKVKQSRNSPRYFEALYKLGWSYYRLSRFAEAISYFTMLVEQFTDLEKNRPRESGGGADLRNEAVEYMAVCFLDYGGVSKANDYLNQIGRPEWGRAVLRKMGDVYRVQKEEYRTAISAYEMLLNYSSFYPEAPQIQRFIADCYRALGDEAKLFETRQRLFSNYQIEGAWWNLNTDERSKLSAHKLGEQAIRENIFELIQKAKTRRSIVLYRQIVGLARNYLQSFPEDVNALLIRWNLALILDSQLHQYQEALQEYLTISLVYDSETYQKFAKEKGLATIQDAALNAVVVADTLVQQEYKLAIQNGLIPARVSVSNAQPSSSPLTEMEKWLILASDNYIKLFPFDSKTPMILANAGALYYTHNQYNEALRYFKTLTKNFPQSEQANQVQLHILESYFGKGDYESVEILSKRLIGEPLPGEVKKSVEKRLAESIFLRAQTLSKQGQFRESAVEYLRMALEAPSADFADRAIFNAGIEYEKIQDYPAAVRAYEMMRTSFRGSPLLADALNNQSINYVALGEYGNAASRFEELSSLQTDSAAAASSLYNAFLYFSKAENWRQAAEIGTDYSIRYAQIPNAPQVYFKTASYYRRLKEDIRSAQIFSSLMDRFPLSPLGVEAGLRAGQIYLETDSVLLAEKAFLRAFELHETLVRKGFEGNSCFAAEALFQAGLLLDRRFQDVALNRGIEEKQKLLRQLIERYGKVAAFQTDRMPESLFRIGRAQEHLAESWAVQPALQTDPTARAVKQKEINEGSVQLYKQSFKSYVSAVELLNKKTASADSSVAETTTDTLTAAIRFWGEKTRAKVSEVLFRIAEINSETVSKLLETPVPRDLNEMASLEYRNQLLSKAISPMVQSVAGEHWRNLIVSDSLGFKGAWVDSSRNRILSVLGLPAGQFQRLAFEALNGFQMRMHQFSSRAKEENAVMPSGFVDEMLNFLELSKSFSQKALLFRKDELSAAVRMNLFQADVASEKQAMAGFVLRMADSLEALSRASISDKEWAEIAFQAQQEPQFEEMLAVFEDNVFFLRENEKTLLEDAYGVQNGFSDPAASGAWIGIRLMQMDYEKYAGNLNIPVETLSLEDDSTWQCSRFEQTGWNRPGFQARGWIPLPGTSTRDTAFNKDGVADWLFIRKDFNIPGVPVFAALESAMDSTGTVSINGLELPGNSRAEYEKPARALVRGRNAAAVRLPRTNFSGWRYRMTIRFVPNQSIPEVQ